MEYQGSLPLMIHISVKRYNGGTLLVKSLHLSRSPSGVDSSHCCCVTTGVTQQQKKVSLSGQQGGIVSRATVVTVGLVQSKVVKSSALIVKVDKQNQKSLTGVIIYVYNRL